MRAAVVTKLGGPSSVEILEVPVPERRSDEVLVRVAAAGVAFPDVLQTRGMYQMRYEPPFILGCEYAGVIVEAPEGAGFAPGDRVIGVGGRGAFAEYIASPVHKVQHLPDEIALTDGAAMPLNLLTAEFTLGGILDAKSTVLIHGAAGGLGMALTQFAVASGARVIAVVSTDAKASVATEVGAHDVIAVDGFRDAVAELTQGMGVDIIVDPVGGERFTDSLRCLAPNGRLLVMGFTSGEIPIVKVNRLLLSNTAVQGVGWSGLRADGNDIGPQWQRLLPLVRSGELNPVINRVFPLEESAAAVALLDLRAANGRVVIQMAPDLIGK